MRQPRPLRIGDAPSRFRMIAIPVITVMAGSIITTLPIIAKSPILPPIGLILLIAWQLSRPDIWPVWIAAPLGLWDDLFSHQPLGSAMFLWTVILLGLQYLDQRMWWRDYWQDWAFAALAIAFALFGGLIMVRVSGPNIRWDLIMPQLLWSILFFPLATRLVGHMDLWRLKR
jgi:rod shape-determining protein MreD